MAEEVGKVAVVTGSNKGIGFAIVRGLCKQFNGDVYLTSRDEQRGREAVAKLQGEGLSPKYHQLDITSLESVQRLKQFLLEKYGGVDVLVNNAGVAYSFSSTAPALEQATMTTITNFSGTLNMMKSFVPILKPHSRIANVSSSTNILSRLTSQSLRDRFSDLALTEAELVSLMEEYVSDVREGKHLERGWGNNLYGVTKIAVTAMTKVFAREAATAGII